MIFFVVLMSLVAAFVLGCALGGMSARYDETDELAGRCLAELRRMHEQRPYDQDAEL
jgi:hypothetical protein